MLSKLKWLSCLCPAVFFTCFAPAYNEGMECSEAATCPPGLTCGSDNRCWRMPPDSRCGDGVVDPGEICDDGNEVSGDGCRADCLSDETCGNGVLDSHMGEECDDGNESDADMCTSACTAASCGDGFRNADEIDVDCGGHCGAGSCELGQVCKDPADCASNICTGDICVAALRASCQEILQAGEAVGDDIYTIDPDGPGDGEPFEVFCDMTSHGGGWTRCLEFTNTEDEDVNDNDWFDTCLAFTMASWTGDELFIKLKDAAGSTAYDATGTRERDWTASQLTSPSPANSQYQLTQHQPVILSSSDWLIIPGKNSNSSGCHGSLGNGYGLVVYPAGATSPAQAKLMAMPYRHQVNSNDRRVFGAGNAQWFVNNELTFDGTTSWDTCGYPPAFLGTLDFYVR